MAIEVKDGSSANKLAVNASGEASVNLPADSDTAGFAIVAAESHPTENGVTREVYPFETNDDYALRTTQEEPLGWVVMAGTAVNTTIHRQGSATATITQTGGWLTLNAGNSTVSGAAAVVTGYQQYELMPTSTLYWHGIIVTAQAAHPSNCVAEWGLATHNAGAGTGTTEPTDGVYFRVSASGVLEGIVRANGFDVGTTGAITNYATLLSPARSHECVVSVSDSIARFWIDRVCVGRIALGAAPSWTLSGTLAHHFRLHNTGVTSTAQQLKIARYSIKRDNVGSPKPFPHAASAIGQHASQGQTGETLGSTANYANSANPAAAVPTNTTAALGSGLGGQFWETDTLAANTDGILCSYQVPAATSAIPGKALYVTSVKVSAFVQTALTGGGYNAVIGLAHGHTAVSLATAEAATTKAPRRLVLGDYAVASGAAVTTKLADFVVPFDPPLCVQPGEFVAVFKKKVGTAPSAGVIAHGITINGYRA